MTGIGRQEACKTGSAVLLNKARSCKQALADLCVVKSDLAKESLLDLDSHCLGRQIEKGCASFLSQSGQATISAVLDGLLFAKEVKGTIAYLRRFCATHAAGFEAVSPPCVLGDS
jgi:hypothetical protein